MANPASSNPNGRRPRRRKFRRDEDAQLVSVQERDRRILVALHEHRLLSARQIALKFFGSESRAVRRMRQLWDGGWVERHWLPVVTGSPQALYTVGPAGVKIVAEELGIDPSDVRVVRQFKTLFVEHLLTVNHVRICFENAIEQHPEAELDLWVGEPDCHERYEAHVEPAGEGKSKRHATQHVFAPDGYGRFLYRDKLYSFFLELDRATMSNQRVVQKARRYAEYAALGLYERRYGVKHFRVLVVTRSEARLANLKRLIEPIGEGRFWFTTLTWMTAHGFFGTIRHYSDLKA